MRIAICAVGRIRPGPEAALIKDYLARFDRAGRAHGFGPAHVIEVAERGGGPASEAALLAAAIPVRAAVVALDERGVEKNSTEFAESLRIRADDGVRDLAFVIGGADGLDPAFLAGVELRLSFGRMVWPHMLARVMLAEQLYRAASILGGHPYHRGGGSG